MSTYSEEIKKSIAKAQAVIVGIGSEFAVDTEAVIGENESYLCFDKYMTLYKADALEKLGNEAYNVIEQYIKHAVYCRELLGGNNKIINKYISSYKKISSLLDGKRYFILTLNTDDIIYEGGFDENNIAAPCGSILRLQSGCDCDSLCHTAKPVLEEIFNIIFTLKEDDEKSSVTKNTFLALLGRIGDIIPKCECQTPRVFNVHSEKKYDESGYMPQWEKYTRWLQLTLNKELVLLELGVGFEAPTVIRWPFEKIAMLNYKAWLYRINSKVPQLPTEIKDKGTSVNENSFEFINADF